LSARALPNMPAWYDTRRVCGDENRMSNPVPGQ
jgi:hypothetical protein